MSFVVVLNVGVALLQRGDVDQIAAAENLVETDAEVLVVFVVPRNLVASEVLGYAVDDVDVFDVPVEAKGNLVFVVLLAVFGVEGIKGLALDKAVCDAVGVPMPVGAAVAFLQELLEFRAYAHRVAVVVVVEGDAVFAVFDDDVAACAHGERVLWGGFQPLVNIRR